jgi:hypothetical protein
VKHVSTETLERLIACCDEIIATQQPRLDDCARTYKGRDGYGAKVKQLYKLERDMREYRLAAQEELLRRFTF